MAILNAYLVPKFDYDTANFGEGDGYFVGLTVAQFLKEAIDGVAEFSGADYRWDVSAASVGFFVCLIVLSGLVRELLSLDFRALAGHLSRPIARPIVTPRRQTKPIGVSPADTVG